MADRILRTNAYTTFDLLDGRIEGHDFEEEALAVLNVTTPRNSDRVTLQIELDNTALSSVPAHADHVELSAAQARELARELDSYADEIDEE